MKVGTFLALLGLLTVIHSAPSNILAQEEVYREAVTDGYVIGNVYLNWFTTESSKTPEAAQTSQQKSPQEGDISEASGDASDEMDTAIIFQYGGKATAATPRAWSTEQPLESKESELLEGRRDTVATVFPQHHVSTTTHLSPDWSTQQSKESDVLERSSDATDVSIVFQHESKHEVSTTTSDSPAWSTHKRLSSETEGSVSFKGSGDPTHLSISLQRSKPGVLTRAGATHTPSPTTAVLTGHADASGSGDVWLNDGKIIHSTSSSSVSVFYTDTNTTPSISTPVLRRTFSPLQNNIGIDLKALNVQSEPQNEKSALLPNMGQKTPGWLIILAVIVGIAALIIVCIAIATRDKWNAPNRAPSLYSESKIKFINQQKVVEKETFLPKDQPRENVLLTEYTVIPLDELPEKHLSG